MIIGQNERRGTWRLSHLQENAENYVQEFSENKAAFCSLVSIARLACCSSGYHHAAKMCLAEKVTFEQFLSRFFIPE